jgi:predicted dehydrogenase
MRCLLRGRWNDLLLDHWRGPGDYRLHVQALVNLERIEDLYFVRAIHPRLVWNYLRQIGPVMVWRKVASRLQERDRNEKWLSIGQGTVLEAPSGGGFEPGATVVFLAPSHPACLERIVLPPELVAPGEPGASVPVRDDAVLYHARPSVEEATAAWWAPVRGWNAFSGRSVPPIFARELGKRVTECLQRYDWSTAQALPLESTSVVAERRESRAARSTTGKQTAVLFGYGHYAKTIIRPNVSEFLTIVAAHEVDPNQIPLDVEEIPIPYWDTSPEPRDDEQYDVYLIAGFHHTHAPLAVSALLRGAYAVSEKPVAVDMPQLTALLEAVSASERGFFACFHKRYSPLNALALHDLGQPPGAPIDYHCIVYEVRLPDLHWYRWPNSKSRLISNGCHWIDHFLYLNGFSEVQHAELFLASNGTINCSVVLRNQALFTMVLTDNGSDRIGLQDHVELRAGNVTVTISNNTYYLAEDRQRILRRVRVNKTHAYRIMYREIARRIGHNEGGDSVDSIRIPTALILDLEAKVNSCMTLPDRGQSSQRRGDDARLQPKGARGR